MRRRGFGLTPVLLGLTLLPALVRAQPDAAVPDASLPVDARAAVPDAGVSGPPLGAVGGHILLELGSDAARVTEVYVLVATETISAPEGEDPWLSLPEGAAGIELERGGERWSPVEGGLALTGELEPGRHTLAFSFLLPAEGGRVLFTHTLPFAVENLHVMWPDGAGFAAQAMGFTEGRAVRMGPRVMRLLERGFLAPGEPLAVVLAAGGEPAPSRQRPEPALRDPLAPVVPVTLILAALVLVAGMLLPMKTRWRR